MDKLREVNEYIDQMKLKKVIFGGYDKDDVYIKINNIIDLFQKCVDKYEEEENSLIRDYEKRMQEQDVLISELNEKIESLTKEQKKTIAEKEKIKAAYKDYCSTILTEYSNSLRSLSLEFTQVLENVAKLQKGLKDNAIFNQIEAIEGEEILEPPEGEKDEK